MKNGKPFNPDDPTIIAARDGEYAKGQCLVMMNPLTGLTQVGYVQDRLPYKRGKRQRAHVVRVDLSPAAAKALGFQLTQGVMWIHIKSCTGQRMAAEVPSGTSFL